MGRGFVAISILLWFLFAPCYHSLIEAKDGAGNPLKNDKYAMCHTEPGNYHGLRAEMSIWGSPNQQSSQESGAAIQMYCQDGGHYSLIEAGFHVSPSLYHNRDVRFFTYWTKDTKSAGCYNLHCKGFVPAKGAALVPGQAVAPSSIYGEADHYARLSLNEDPNTGDWVLYRHDLDTPSFLGHFPKELCPTATRIQALTGFVNYLNTTSGPPMGSGHFPDDEDPKRSAYFKHVKMYDSKGHAWDPVTTSMFNLVDKTDCYRATEFFFDFKKGYMFYYGGPSGCVD
ncbi:unnamed protein product [Alopecurus aequalis]